MAYDKIIVPAEGAELPVDKIGTTDFPRTKMAFGAEGSATDVSAADPMPVEVQELPLPNGAATEATVASIITALTALAAALETIELGASTLSALETITVGGNVELGSASLAALESITATGPLTDAQLRATPLAVPSGAATSAKQDLEIAAITTIGTRAYGTALARIAVTSTSAQSAAITATEVLVHASARCFIAVGSNPTATNGDIPLEAGEKFHLRITSGHKVAVLQDTVGGFLNVVPVA